MNAFFKYVVLYTIGMVLTAGMVFYAPCRSAFAEDISAVSVNTGSADETMLFELINAARKDPLGTAASLGMNPDQILADFPDLTNMLTQGLPALAFNDRLYQSAGDHCRDMLANGYYAYESLDGTTVADRINQAGYPAIITGESLGLLFFYNFINSEKAIHQIFENIFKDELNPQWTGQRNILNPNMKDIGVSVTGGPYKLQGFAGNVYLVTCDFGAAVLADELELMQMVNQARANPWAVTESYNIDVQLLLTLYPDLIVPFYSGGLPPVSFNKLLYAAAGEHVADMLANGYFEDISPAGLTPDMRMRNLGYVPVWSGLSMALISSPASDALPEQTVSRLFSSLFLNSLMTRGDSSQTIFSLNAMETGLKIISGESDVLGGIFGNQVQLAVDYFGATEIVAAPSLIGLVYNDINQNSLYDPGEELPNTLVKIENESYAKIFVTNPAGGFSIALPPGVYTVSVGGGDTPQVQSIEVDGVNNKWLAVKVDPNPAQ